MRISDCRICLKGWYQGEVAAEQRRIALNIEFAGHCTLPKEKREVRRGARYLDVVTAVSERGLEHPFGWYITETVIYHQPKLTRQGPPGSAFRRRIAAAPPGRHDQSERLTCGNDDRGQLARPV